MVNRRFHAPRVWCVAGAWPRALVLALVWSGGGFAPAAEAPPFLWASRAGGPGSDWVVRARLDSGGHFYATGEAGPQFNHGGTNYLANPTREMFLTKFGHAGNLLWSRRAGGSNSLQTFGAGLAVSPTGAIYVAGQFSGNAIFGPTNLNAGGTFAFNVYLARYDPDGNLEWVKHVPVGGPRTQPTDGVAAMPDGGAVLMSTVGGPVDLGATNLTHTGTVLFLARTDAAGATIWAAPVTSTGAIRGQAVATDDNGAIYVTGEFSGTANFGGVFLTATGPTRSGFVAKYDAAGHAAWATNSGGTGYHQPLDVALDSAGQIYVVGGFSGTAQFGTNTVAATGGSVDVFAARFDHAGTPLWARSSGGAGDDFGVGVALAGGTNLLVTGYFTGSARFGAHELRSRGVSDAFVTKYDPAGNVVWVTQAGGVYANSSLPASTGRSIAVSAGGSAYVAGQYNGSPGIFGDLTLTNAGAGDLFFARLAPFPAPPLELAANGPDLELRWPESPPGFDLEQSLNLVIGSWLPVAGPTNVIGQTNLVTAPLDAGQTFFRLRRTETGP